jgi:catechol 2,3-dioxygenase-like lactoylglutathione lyase family enzyme
MARKRDYMVLHVDLFVRSMDTALEFYRDKLGFSVVDSGMVRGPLVLRMSDGQCDALRLVLLRTSTVGAMIELQEFLSEGTLTQNASALPLRKGWVSILVPDLRAHIDQLMEHDIRPASEVFVVNLPNTRACEAVIYNDPDGNDLEFLQIRR